MAFSSMQQEVPGWITQEQWVEGMSQEISKKIPWQALLPYLASVSRPPGPDGQPTEGPGLINFFRFVQRYQISVDK
jgi:hypothetical protein